MLFGCFFWSCSSFAQRRSGSFLLFMTVVWQLFLMGWRRWTITRGLVFDEKGWKTTDRQCDFVSSRQNNTTTASPANVSLSDNDEKLLILPLMVQYATWVYRLPGNSPDVTQVHHWLFMGVWVNLHFWKSASVIVTICTNNSPTGVKTLTDTLWGFTSNS